ncbi:MAG: DUF1611 domain-containing protein [Pseudonocardiaceae bacterium]
MPTVSLTPQRVARWKAAYTTRNLDLQRPFTVVHGDDLAPRHGDLMLARVTAIGQHPRLELATGRRATLYLDDEVLVVAATRYAPDQFEAELPTDLGPCHLVAAGGIAGRARSAHTKMNTPTELAPIGLLADSGGAIINLSHLALPSPAPSLRRPPTLIVAGTSMNAGKSTAVAAVTRGFTAAGLRVGAAKITGTGAGGDPWLFRDAGAAEVLDFTDIGLATTYQLRLSVLLDCATGLHATLACRGVNAIVLEIADGVLQAETAALLSHPRIRALTDGVLFAASDAAGALLGVQWLRAAGLPVLAVGGLLTAAPLAICEAQAGLDVPVYRTSELSDPVLAHDLLDRLITPRTTRIAIGNLA